jgi:hypothetical protein
MTTKLIDAIKKLRERQAAPVLIQNVEWDLDPSFIGEPMVPRVLKQLSLFVDKKLSDYSAIYGANAATNMPRALLDYGDEPTLNLNNVRMGHIPERPPTCEEPTNQIDIIQPGPVTIYDDTGEGIQVSNINVQKDQLTINNLNTSNLRGYPGVRNREELEARVRDGEGYIIDDPDLFSDNWMVKQHLRHQEATDEYTGPQVEAYIPEIAAVIEDDHVASEMEDLPQLPIVDREFVQMREGQNTERDTLLLSEITLPPGSSLLQGSETNRRNEVVPAEDQGIPHGADYHHELTFNEVTQRCITTGRQVEGLNPLNFQPNNEYFNNGAGGIDPTREGVDNHVYAHGAPPGVRFRIRDSFIRNRHLTLKVPQYELMGPGSGGKDIAYVTSYTVEHQTQKIKARIITAPICLTLDDETWFELCTDGSGISTLKDIVKNTVKANLCIYKPSRSTYYDTGINVRAEKTALETLRDMITEQEFRNYARYGFLTVRGSSGCTYQIPRDGRHTKIWEYGKLIEEVCIRIQDRNVPPTDNVIAFKTMIETNEDLFKSLGNVYKMDKKVA